MIFVKFVGRQNQFESPGDANNGVSQSSIEAIGLKVPVFVLDCCL